MNYIVETSNYQPMNNTESRADLLFKYAFEMVYNLKFHRDLKSTELSSSQGIKEYIFELSQKQLRKTAHR